MNINPNLAEALMSTFYAGSEMSDEYKNKCELIWKELNNDRSEILKKVVYLCGDIDTPQTRYLKALSWSFNRIEFSTQRIDSINDYLSHELYEKAYISLVGSLKYGIEYGKRFHIANMLQYLAQAYCHLKDYDNEEKTYKRIYELNILIPNGCVLLAKYYKKRNNIAKAIETLKNEKNSKNYLTNVDYRKAIDDYLLELEKKRKGINKHLFDGYDTFQSGFINGEYYPELEKKGMELRKKYENIFNYHREFLEKIDLCEYNIKRFCNLLFVRY